MYVGVDDFDDPQPMLLGRRQILRRFPLGIDDRRNAPTRAANEVGGTRVLLVEELSENHPFHLSEDPANTCILLHTLQLVKCSLE